MKKLLISSIACLSMIASSVVAALPAAVDGVALIALDMAPSLDHSPDMLALDAVVVDEADVVGVPAVQPIDGVGIPLEVTASAQSSPIPDFALSGGDGPPA